MALRSQYANSPPVLAKVCQDCLLTPFRGHPCCGLSALRMSEIASIGVSVPPPGQRLPIHCRCCGGQNVEMFLDLSDQPHCNRLLPQDAPAGAEPRYPLRVGFCHDCTMVQIDHTIPKETMFSDYP